MINKELLAEMINKGYVSKRKHPSADLWIYNYTASCQYERIWNEVTKITRGLILNEKMEVISRPFPKFFNWEELESDEIPYELHYEITEKMDGSLGIGYWLGEKFQIATRGSFESEQAKHANMILAKKYKNIEKLLQKDKTYLFEIIYPENRIVVNYKDFDDLVFLTAIDNKTGKDIQPVEKLPFPKVKTYKRMRIEELKKLNIPNKEGFVIRFENSFRMKVKFEEYVRLHKIISGLSVKKIWEYLRDGLDLDSLIKELPDEFHKWVKSTGKELNEKFRKIEKQCSKIYREYPTRKETAIYFQQQKYPGILFSMLDNKDYTKQIWEIIKPKQTELYK